MFKRQREGSVVCPYCGKLVGVNDKECYNCGKRNPGMWGFAPLLRRFGYNLGFVPIVIWGCAGLFIATLLYDPHSIRSGGLSLIQPSFASLFTFGASGSIPFFEAGRWWTLLSAGWLHGGVLHILFNMLWVRQLAPATSELYGISRTVIIYTVSSVAGFLLSSLTGLIIGRNLTMGASAAIFGLLGALVVYGRRRGSQLVSKQAMTYAVILFIFGFIFPGVDNAAHLGGFAGGFAIAWMLNPLQQERVEHFIAAVACLVLTALSILVSFLQTPRFY